MPEETQELQLVATLVDQATPALLKLKGLLQDVSVSGLEKFKRDVEEIEKKHKQVAEHTGKIHEGVEEALRGITKFASQVTGLPIAEFTKLTGEATKGIAGIAAGLASIPFLLHEVNESLNEFSERMGTISTRSKALAMDAGQFKVLADQMTKFEYSAEEAGQTVNNIFQSLTRIARPGTAEQSVIGRLFADPGQARDQLLKIERLRERGREGSQERREGEAEALRQTFEFLHQIEEKNKERLGEGREDIAAQMTDEIAQALFRIGPKWRSVEHPEKIIAATQQQVDKTKKDVKKAEETKETMSQLNTELTNFKNTIDNLISGPMNDLNKAITGVVQDLTKWTEGHPGAALGIAASGFVVATIAATTLMWKVVGALGGLARIGMAGPAAAGGAATAGAAGGGGTLAALYRYGLRGGAIPLALGGLEVMREDAKNNNELRTKLRSLLGIEDPHEPSIYTDEAIKARQAARAGQPFGVPAPLAPPEPPVPPEVKAAPPVPPEVLAAPPIRVASPAVRAPERSGPLMPLPAMPPAPPPPPPAPPVVPEVRPPPAPLEAESPAPPPPRAPTPPPLLVPAEVVAPPFVPPEAAIPPPREVAAPPAMPPVVVPPELTAPVPAPIAPAPAPPVPRPEEEIIDRLERRAQDRARRHGWTTLPPAPAMPPAGSATPEPQKHFWDRFRPQRFVGGDLNVPEGAPSTAGINEWLSRLPDSEAQGQIEDRREQEIRKQNAITPVGSDKEWLTLALGAFHGLSSVAGLIKQMTGEPTALQIAATRRLPEQDNPASTSRREHSAGSLRPYGDRVLKAIFGARFTTQSEAESGGVDAWLSRLADPTARGDVEDRRKRREYYPQGTGQPVYFREPGTALDLGGVPGVSDEDNRFLKENTDQLRRLNDWLDMLNFGSQIRIPAGLLGAGGGAPGGLGAGGGGTGGGGGPGGALGAGGGPGAPVAGGGAPGGGSLGLGDAGLSQLGGIGKVLSGGGGSGLGRALGGGLGAEGPSIGTLAQQRARFADELKNPEAARLLAASTEAEVGGQGPKAQQAYIESVMNRASARGKTLTDTLRDRRYYPPTTINKLDRPVGAGAQANIDAISRSVLAGSNISNFATGNESGPVHSGGAPVTLDLGPKRERFVQENFDRRWVGQQQRLAGTTPQVGPPGTPSATPGATDAPQGGRPIGTVAALALAKQHLGDDEIRDNAKLSSFFGKQGIRIDPAQTAWCAAFVNAELGEAGVKGTGSLAAASFYKWGHAASGPVQPGDIGVMPHHVGFLTGRTQMRNGQEYVEMLGGNQGGTVSGKGGVSLSWRPRSSLSVRRGEGSGDPGSFAGLGGSGAGGAGPGGGTLGAPGYSPRGDGDGLPSGFGGRGGVGDIASLLMSRFGGGRGGVGGIANLLMSELGGRGGLDSILGGLGGSLDRFSDGQNERASLDRRMLDRGVGDMIHKVEGTGKLSVDVNAPPGTNVRASGTGFLKRTEINRQTQMALTQSGPKRPADAGFAPDF
jgi:uncharacterized protein (TIGR02594 family)